MPNFLITRGLGGLTLLTSGFGPSPSAAAPGELFARKTLRRQFRPGIKFANPIDGDPRNITHGGPRVWHVNTVMLERMLGGEESFFGIGERQNRTSGVVDSSFRFPRSSGVSPTLAAVIGGDGRRRTGRDRALPVPVPGSGPTGPGGEPVFDWVDPPSGGDEEGGVSGSVHINTEDTVFHFLLDEVVDDAIVDTVGPYTLFTTGSYEVLPGQVDNEIAFGGGYAANTTYDEFYTPAPALGLTIPSGNTIGMLFTVHSFAPEAVVNLIRLYNSAFDIQLYLAVLEDGTISVFYNNVISDHTPTPLISTGTRYHLVCVQSGASAFVYLNGALVFTTTGDDPGSLSVDVITISDESALEENVVSLDEVWMEATPWTSEQVQDEYDRAISGGVVPVSTPFDDEEEGGGTPMAHVDVGTTLFHFSMDETSGDCNDSVGSVSGLVLTDYGTQSLVGTIGNQRDFSDSASMDADTGFTPFSFTDFTLGLIYTPIGTGGGGTIVDFSDSGPSTINISDTLTVGELSITLDDGGGRVTFETVGANVIDGAGPYHIQLTRTGTTIKLYVNGVDTTLTPTGDVPSGALGVDYIYIGNANDFYVDDFWAETVAYTPEQALAEYQHAFGV